jgi:hypothetical protein
LTLVPGFVRDANGQALAFIYCEDEPGRRATAKLADPRRGAAHRRQHRQAAGAIARAGAERREVARLQPHTSRQSAQCPLRHQFQKYRRNALSGVMGQKMTHETPQSMTSSAVASSTGGREMPSALGGPEVDHKIKSWCCSLQVEARRWRVA